MLNEVTFSCLIDITSHFTHFFYFVFSKKSFGTILNSVSGLVFFLLTSMCIENRWNSWRDVNCNNCKTDIIIIITCSICVHCNFCFQLDEEKSFNWSNCYIKFKCLKKQKIAKWIFHQQTMSNDLIDVKWVRLFSHQIFITIVNHILN